VWPPLKRRSVSSAVLQKPVSRPGSKASWTAEALQTDIRNAGGKWVDHEVVQDGRLTTSRKPDDIPMFNRKVLEAFAS
jgi:putative intracellular protease/amidase